LADGENYARVFKLASARDWAALRAAIDQAKQTIPLLKKQLVAQRDLINALTGQFPGAGVAARVPRCSSLMTYR
jgi:outer membrane protein TolC